MVHHMSGSSRRFEILCTLPDTKAGVYSPPKDCKFTTTIFNISVTSHGRQFDRLALLFLGDIEVWRTSTAMPIDVGIYWSYQQDMTTFDTILKIEQSVIFDLSNVYSDLYTGAYNVALEALYYNDQYVPDLSPADHILPISALASLCHCQMIMGPCLSNFPGMSKPRPSLCWHLETARKNSGIPMCLRNTFTHSPKIRDGCMVTLHSEKFKS